MDINVKTQQETEQEMLELNRQFGEFLRTKGISAKFKVAFDGMADSARRQREKDKAAFEAVKAQSAEENADFIQFIHTKGLKAKYDLVVENIKKGAAAAPSKTAAGIARVKAGTAEAVARANARGGACSAEAANLAREFNEFLKAKGLDTRYTVSVTDK